MNIKLLAYRKKERLRRNWNWFIHSQCTVLLYHRIVELVSDSQQLCVSPEVFRDQLKHLKKRYTFLSVDEFYNHLVNNRKFPKKSLLLTFDDGYADNFHNALPILEDQGLQALFYIATNRLNSNQLFWWDELDIIFSIANRDKVDLLDLAKSKKLLSTNDLYGFYHKNCKLAKSLENRENLLKELREIILISEDYKKDYKFLSKEELVRMSKSKSVIIGAHTINHLSLAHLSEADQKYEIEGSVQRLSDLLAYKIEHFSFPYGEKHNYNEGTIRICKELGLKSAAANYCDRVMPDSDIFSFPRFVVRNDGAELLLNKLKNGI